jgi:hypothetical protein
MRVKRGYWITDGEQTGVFLDYRIDTDEFAARLTVDGPTIWLNGQAISYATVDQVEATGFAGTGYGRVMMQGAHYG